MNKLAGLLVVALTVAACGSRTPEPAADQYETATAERRPLVLVVEAAGVIEPIRTVELKSKASGEILELGAERKQEILEAASQADRFLMVYEDVYRHLDQNPRDEALQPSVLN